MTHEAKKNFKTILEDMLVETRTLRLLLLTSDLDEIMLQREHELATGDHHTAEHMKLIKAMDQLYELKVQKLGMPDWRAKSG
jgi:anion-transporting  ArsA/GET3 family ATPase